MPMIDTDQTPLLQCRGISKRFGGETALDDVDFTLQAGEVHGIVGSNENAPWTISGGMRSSVEYPT